MNYRSEAGCGYAILTSCDGVVQIDMRSPIVELPKLQPDDVLGFDSIDIGGDPSEYAWGYKAERTGGTSAAISVIKSVSKALLAAHGYSEFAQTEFAREMFTVMKNAGGFSSAIKFTPVYRGLMLAAECFSDKASLYCGDRQTQSDLDEIAVDEFKRSGVKRMYIVDGSPRIRVVGTE